MIKGHMDQVPQRQRPEEDDEHLRTQQCGTLNLKVGHFVRTSAVFSNPNHLWT